MPVHKAVRPIGYVAALSCLALLSVVVADNGRAAAVPPVLDIPVACEPGRDCFIQFYVDRDESVESVSRNNSHASSTQTPY